MTKLYNVSNWKVDMIRLLSVTATEQNDVVLIVTESHMRKPFVLEDINSLINSGDIPNLFSQEEFIPLIDKIRKIAKKNNKTQLLEFGTNN